MTNTEMREFMKDIILKKALEKLNTDENMDRRIMETVLKKGNTAAIKHGRRKKYGRFQTAAVFTLILLGTVTTVTASVGKSYFLKVSDEVEFYEPVEYMDGKLYVSKDGKLNEVEQEQTEWNLIECENVEEAFQSIKRENLFPTYLADRRIQKVEYDPCGIIFAYYKGSDSVYQNIDIQYYFESDQLELNENDRMEIKYSLPGGKYKEEALHALKSAQRNDYTTKNGLKCLISDYEAPNHQDTVHASIQLDQDTVLNILIGYYDTFMEQEELYQILDSIPEM